MKENPIPKNFFENIVATMPQPIGVWDKDLRPVYTNPAWQRLMAPLTDGLELSHDDKLEAQLQGDLRLVFALAAPATGSLDLNRLGFDSPATYTVKLVDSQHCMVVINPPQPSSQIKSARPDYTIGNQHYRYVFDSINEGFCIIEVMFDEQGRAYDYRFLESNPAFARHTGLENATGRTLREIAPALDESWFKIYGRVAKTGRTERIIEQLSAKDRWFEVDAVRLKNCGECTVALLLRDVTERKLAEEELLRVLGLLEGIAQGSEDLIAALDRNFRFLYCNDAYRREFQRLWRFDVQVGSSLLEALAPWPQEQSKLQSLWSRALNGESFRVQADFGPDESQRRIYDLRFNPIRDPHGRAVGAAHIFRDITDQVRVQDELRASEERLRESDRRKDEYLAMLGHELRNPLSAVRNATELIKNSSVIDKRLHDASSVLERQTRHMARLLDGLLEVSRIARGKIGLSREVIDVGTILRGVLKDRAGHVANRHITLVENLPSEPAWVYGDPVRLAQVFDNLMGNAIKFCEPGDVIKVGLTRLCDRVKVTVSDSGVGISPELIDRIFEPFFQGQQDIARATGGLGLGLALVKGLTELHKGRVEVCSDGLGHGSRFTITLPASEAPRQSRADQLPPLQSSRILIVEDNADAGRTLCELLRMQGHEVKLLEGAVQALNYLWQQGADIVLCDLGLPDMSGYDFARTVRRDETLRHIPLVAVTGYGQPDDRRRSKAAGFDEHLTKPVDLQILLTAIRRLLYSHAES